MLTKTRLEQYHENGFVAPTTPRLRASSHPSFAHSEFHINRL